MIFLIMLLIFSAAGVLFYAAIPLFVDKTLTIGQRRSKIFERKMERVIMKPDIQRMAKFYVIAPLIFGVAGYFLLPVDMRLMGITGGVVLGFLGPSIYIKFLVKKRKDKFSHQLIDALMIMSSSFRGGLSLIQALEAVVEEMPDPISQELGTVLNENKMGVSLEEALGHLYSRMPSVGIHQTITAILLARETGGNLPVIFSRIVNTLRERIKIQQNIDTLTLQGKIQGVVMTLLPFVFGFVVYGTNPKFFDSMIHTEIGRRLLICAAVAETIGAYLIWKISTFKDF